MCLLVMDENKICKENEMNYKWENCPQILLSDNTNLIIGRNIHYHFKHLPPFTKWANSSNGTLSSLHIIFRS